MSANVESHYERLLEGARLGNEKGKGARRVEPQARRASKLAFDRTNLRSRLPTCAQATGGKPLSTVVWWT